MSRNSPLILAALMAGMTMPIRKVYNPPDQPPRDPKYDAERIEAARLKRERKAANRRNQP